VIGMSDGLTVPFALAAGLSGATAASGLVVIAGLAEIAAGSIAMGLGGYLASRTDAEHYDAERQREEREREEKERAERGVSPEAGQEIETKIRREREEQKIRAERQAELAKLARISMDQAIQIATSKTPGKVLECSLVGEHWEGPGELAKPSMVLYHVVVLSGDEIHPVTMHVLVNAVDGTIFRTEKQERKTEAPYMKPYMQSEQPRTIEGGKLNGKALSLPEAAYPDIARAARAQGDVDVRIVIDEGGNVIEAQAVSGHPLLRAAAVNAARAAKFNPTRLSGEPVKVSGLLTYNCLLQ